MGSQANRKPPNDGNQKAWGHGKEHRRDQGGEGQTGELLSEVGRHAAPERVQRLQQIGREPPCRASSSNAYTTHTTENWRTKKALRK